MSEVTCDHCGLPVPAGLVDREAEQQFCCNGCRMVFEAISGCGLDQYYAIKAQTDDTAVQGRTTSKRYEEFDDSTFRDLYCRPVSDSRQSIELYLESVHCAACVWLIEKLPHAVEGVVEARLDIRRSLARIVWDPARVTLSQIARALDALGYPSHPFRGVKMRDVRRAEDRAHMIRIGVAAACAMNVMVIAFALYGEAFGDMDPLLRSMFRWASLGITIVALLWPGRVFFVGALASWRTRTMHMDVPVAIALALGTTWNAINTITNTGHVYFESLTAVIVLLLIGRWIQHRQQWAANDAVELLYSLTPATARLVDDAGVVREVPVEAVQRGQVVEVRAGDSIPVDGAIEDGTSELDLSLLTGESRPVRVTPEDRVHAGSVNLMSRLLVRVEATGEATRIGRLMNMVEQCARDRPPVVRLADRLAHYFVIVVLLLAAATLVLWLFIEPSRAVEHAVTLLIVTCPCALGLATPLAVVAGIGRAAKSGILIKGGEIVEQLAQSGRVFLDKTGTVTRGETALMEWVGDEGAKRLALAVEAQSSHPMARAIVRAFGEQFETMDAQVEQAIGAGVVGEVSDQSVMIGSPVFIRSQVGLIAQWVHGAEAALVDRALSPVFVAVDGAVVAVAGFGDPLEDDAIGAVDSLRRLGWDVGMLSGDHPRVVESVSRQLGLDDALCLGGAAPERKLAVVQQAVRDISSGRPVVMVGDGVNDAAALSAASVGVAVHGGAEASLAAADVFMTRPGLDPVVALMRGSRRTVDVIKRNLAVSLIYNLVSATLAMAGVINPLIAAILMPLSSLSVVTISYRARTFDA